MMSESFRGMNPVAVETAGTALTELGEAMTATVNVAREKFSTMEWHGTDATTFETEITALFDELTELGNVAVALADTAVNEAAEQRTASES